MKLQASLEILFSMLLSLLIAVFLLHAYALIANSNRAASVSSLISDAANYTAQFKSACQDCNVQ